MLSFKFKCTIRQGKKKKMESDKMFQINLLAIAEFLKHTNISGKQEYLRLAISTGTISHGSYYYYSLDS